MLAPCAPFAAPRTMLSATHRSSWQLQRRGGGAQQGFRRLRPAAEVRSLPRRSGSSSSAPRGKPAGRKAWRRIPAAPSPTPFLPSPRLQLGGRAGSSSGGSGEGDPHRWLPGGRQGGRRKKARQPGLFEVEDMSPPSRSLGIHALPPVRRREIVLLAALAGSPATPRCLAAVPGLPCRRWPAWRRMYLPHCSRCSCLVIASPRAAAAAEHPQRGPGRDRWLQLCCAVCGAAVQAGGQASLPCAASSPARLVLAAHRSRRCGAAWCSCCWGHSAGWRRSIACLPACLPDCGAHLPAWLAQVRGKYRRDHARLEVQGTGRWMANLYLENVFQLDAPREGGGGSGSGSGSGGPAGSS